jgi:hypothetical protein
VLLLLLSKDPDRVQRYHRIEATGPESLGSDAYDLWLKMPEYMLNRTVKRNTQSALKAYETAHQGTMGELMERRGLGDLYNTILAQQEEIERWRRAKARKGQTNVIIIGCAGMGAILIMILTVLLIIGLQMTS